ncbi:PLP-dependent transferase [Metschnikowia bicuspidata var. bicuspidata NRRL YB-4993]|uniref:cystathionine gamma-synthase n=1 Tax=Metschnikowia bicuspidata var. bicuspidata NRRL YB-4993 TaxID=869754 RepID=A0A1A0HHC9_9ASCO|nr:PLP-dependent transferase [Metschnikowia bicuspidata var. bicuspidata NRRL YB-4993]OBA23405.1 PLP-dependent transferase [Metschnikowia bicuspidata var. bicuspidata NRRL YB-4993]
MTQSGPSQNVGDTIPNNTAHAVSVTLPTWRAVVGYEEGESWVLEKMTSGYPRFFIHSIIQDLAKRIEAKYVRDGERCMLFPSSAVAKRCREFIRAKSNKPNLGRRLLQFTTSPPRTEFEKSSVLECTIVCVIMPEEDFPLAKQYWQHAGEGVSSRLAEYVLKELFEKEEKPQGRRSRSKQELQAQNIQRKSPSISASMRSESMSQNENVDREFNTFIEQKYGRVLDLKFATQAKVALRRRIAGKADLGQTDQEYATVEDKKRGTNINEDDVYLYPTGMASIFNAHQAILGISLIAKKLVCFGFPYVDTLSILRKFGPGCHFYGFGDDDSLDVMEKGLESGDIDIAGFFCECPSNPLLKTPNLKRVRALADKYNFVVVIDETVGNFLNVAVLQYADMIVSSLTKIFSGDSNVMGGSLILNRSSPMYRKLKGYFDINYEDIVWAEDALYLERNSRDFEERSKKVNETSLAVVELLQSSPLVSQIFYPSISESRKFYDEIKTLVGGYGGLISFFLKEPKRAPACFDAMNLHKGPSLGTNFSLACPYAILAHYQELDEVEKWGVDRNLIRISIGLEDKDELLATLQDSLDVAAAVP